MQNCKSLRLAAMTSATLVNTQTDFDCLYYLLSQSVELKLAYRYNKYRNEQGQIPTHTYLTQTHNIL